MPAGVAACVECSGDGCPRGGSRDGREVEREVGGDRSASGRVERDVEACRPRLARGVQDTEVAVRPELPARRDVEADAGAVAREAAVAAGDRPWPEAERSSSLSSSWSRWWWSSRSLSSSTCRERPLPPPRPRTTWRRRPRLLRPSSGRQPYRERRCRADARGRSPASGRLRASPCRGARP